jgi:hypothetical protein
MTDGSKTIWQRGVDAGDVTDEPDDDHPFRVVGFVFTGEGMYHGADDDQRVRQIVNKPKFISARLAEQLFRAAFKSSFDERWRELSNGQTVETSNNRYQQVEEL